MPQCKFLGEAAECNDSLQTVIALQTSLRFAATSCRVQTLLREQLELRPNCEKRREALQAAAASISADSSANVGCAVCNQLLYVCKQLAGSCDRSAAKL